MKYRQIAVALSLVLAALAGKELHAEGANSYSSSDFGGVGLFQTRTARFGQNGNFEVGVSYIRPYRRYIINAQAFSWLEGTFRYTEINNRGYYSTGVIRGGETTYKDRGADIKLRLKKEGRWTPAVAVGLQDGLGTGQFSGEYVVASKRFHDFDFSLGMGWGYSGKRGGTKNPLGSLVDSFKSRQSNSQFGGTLVVGNWFRGPEVALFGGVEYFTPIRGLSIKIEMDGNNYDNEPLANRFDQSLGFNVGFNYRPFPWFEVTTAFERGQDFMVRVTMRANFDTAGMPKIDPGPPTLVPRQKQVPSEESALPYTDARFVSSTMQAEMALLDRRRISPAFSSVRSSLAREGINALPGQTGAGVDVILEGPGAMPPLIVLTRAASAAESYGASEVVFSKVDGGVRNSTVRIPLGLVSDAEIADFFFDEADKLGIAILDISFDANSASLLVEGDVGQRALQHLALLTIISLPEAIEEVVVKLSPNGEEHRFARAEITNPEGEAVGQNTPETHETREGGELRKSKSPFAISEAIFSDLRAAGLLGDAISISNGRITIWVNNLRYTKTAQAIGRTARVVATHAPSDVEEIEVVLVAGSMELSRTTVQRRDLENAVIALGSAEEILARGVVRGPSGSGIPPDAIRNGKRFPAMTFSIGPMFKQHIGGGDIFFAYAVGLRAAADIELAPGLMLGGTITRNLIDTFDELTVNSNSELPRVRSDIKDYLQGSGRNGDTAITRLQGDYLAMIAPDLYGRLSAGIFEDMYGGYGGEILYRPFGGRAAIGANLNWVRQRDFDGRISFLDYSVVTGHLSIYYEAPFQDLLLITHIGQYLAGDRGATFEVSRRFRSGVRAGVFTTFTDVPFELFGEGSFDKGVFISLPLELFLLTPTRKSGTVGFRPLTRDGGQMVSIRPRLYDIAGQANSDNVLRDWDSFVD